MSMPKEKKPVNIFESVLVPKHEILSEEEKANLLEDLKISTKNLPKIKSDDPAIVMSNPKKDDVVRIHRKTPYGGNYYYYRMVVMRKDE